MALRLSKSIKEILSNPVYVGAIAYQKADYRFKIGWIGDKKPENWTIADKISLIPNKESANRAARKEKPGR